MHRGIRLTGKAPVEECHLCRLRTLLQLLSGGQPGGAALAEQLVAGQRIVDQAAQAVVQAHLARVIGPDAALAKVFQQRQTRCIGLCRPAFQQPGLLGGLGGQEKFALAGLSGQG